MRCATATKQGEEAAEKCGVNFKMCFCATWPPMAQGGQWLLYMGWGGGRWSLRFVIAFTGDSTSSTRWAKTETQLVVSLPPPNFRSSLLLILLLFLCFALLHSLCLLDLPVSSTQLVVARGRRRWRRRWGTNGPLLFWHVYGVHTTHTHTHRHIRTRKQHSRYCV